MAFSNIAFFDRVFRFCLFCGPTIYRRRKELKTFYLTSKQLGGNQRMMSNGWSLNGEGFYDAIDAKDLEAYGGSVKLTVPLS